MELDKRMGIILPSSHEEAIKIVTRMGYTREEAINLLDGKNADGSEFEPWIY